MTTEEFLILAVLIGLSAFFSGAETAFISLGRAKLKTMLDKGSKNAEIIKKLKDDPHRLLSTILIGNNIVNIAASAIATSIAIRTFGDIGIGIATGVMTFFLLIFGEITPKTLAVSNSEAICAFSAPIIYFLSRALSPFIWLCDLVTKSISKTFTGENKQPAITEEEIKSFINMGEELGSIEKDEKEMIDNIFCMNDTQIKDVMVPRINIISVEAGRKISQVMNKLIHSAHARIPVFDGEKVIGILYAKDVMKEIVKGRTDKKVEKIMMPAYFVPETKKTDLLLQDFQRKKTHIAIVVNEYGEVTGLVTLEDVLEEIVGEIYDETDEVRELVKQLDSKNFELDGEATLKEICKKTGKKLLGGGDYTTISGYVLNKLSRIPKNDEVIDSKSYQLKIASVVDNRICKVLMSVK